MSRCCGPAVPAEVFFVDEATTLDQLPVMPPKSPSLCSLPEFPVYPSDFKGVMIEIRKDSAASAIRQEKCFAQILKKQAEFQEEMRSATDLQVLAQEIMRKLHEDTLAQVMSFITKEFIVGGRPKSETAGSGLTVAGCPKLETAGTGELEEHILDTQSDEHILDTQKMQADTALAAEEDIIPISPTRSSSASDPSRQLSRDTLSKKFSFQSDTPEVEATDRRKRAHIKRMLSSKEFEMVIAFAILSNALVMFWEGQYHGLDVGFRLLYPGRPTEAHVVWANAETGFDVADWFFGLLFSFEASFKISFWRLDYLRNMWNLLDLLCVAAFAFAKLAKGSVGFSPGLLRLLRLFRLVRLVRLLRFVENLDHLYVMTTTIAGLGKVLAWAAVLLTLLLLACNLFLTQVLHATYFSGIDASDLTDDQLKKHHEMYSYFGTCSRCMLSMFEIALGNWPPVARLLSEEVSQWFVVICVLHKLTIGFAVISVINGVILQETFKVAQTDDMIMLRQKKRASDVMRSKMEALFEVLDADGNGDINKEEFVAIMAHDSNLEMWLASLEIETDDLSTLFSLCDCDNNGRITLQEIVSRMPRLRGSARSIDVLNLKKQIDQLQGLKQPSQ